MNKVLKEIREIISSKIIEYLPEVKLSELEDNGAVFYMNGRNGTEYDWYVNNRLSDFFIFYNDEANMGALKAIVYKDGTVLLYIYNNHGKNLIKESEMHLKSNEEEIFNLAVQLKEQADEKCIFDVNIEKIETDLALSSSAIETFKCNIELYEDMIQRKKILPMFAYVSRRILDDGFNVGYMRRDKSLRDGDSGWCFMSGEESDEYMNDYQHIALLRVGEVIQLDHAIWPFINCPVGSAYIRVSKDKMEEDHEDKPIFVSKYENR